MATQLTLFTELTAPSTSTVGLLVKLRKPCRCGAAVGVLGSSSGSTTAASCAKVVARLLAGPQAGPSISSPPSSMILAAGWFRAPPSFSRVRTSRDSSNDYVVVFCGNAARLCAAIYRQWLESDSVPFRTKRPSGIAWQGRVITAETAPVHFNGDPINIGVVLGPTSQGLTDIDLDCAQAIAIAPYVLPPTKARFGRVSKRESHRLYITNLAATGKAVVQFPNPVAEIDPTTGKKMQPMLLELRIGGGAQTIFPGSTHESGEVVAWEERGDPAHVDGADLRQRVEKLAAYTLIARYWPGEGQRHAAALALGGFLSRTGLSPAEVRIVAEAVAKAADDPEFQERRRSAEIQQGHIKKEKRALRFPAPCRANRCRHREKGRRVAWLPKRDRRC